MTAAQATVGAALQQLNQVDPNDTAAFQEASSRLAEAQQALDVARQQIQQYSGESYTPCIDQCHAAYAACVAAGNPP